MTTPDISPSVIQALLRAQAVDESSAGKEGSTGPFTIAVSREAGALGSTVAQEVGRQLGWRVYDRELIDEIARAAHQPPHSVEAVDERPSDWLGEVANSLVAPARMKPFTYLKYLRATLTALGARGGCIIVGRGAFCLLPPERTLRVRLIGDLADRVRVVAARRGISEKEAREWIARTDAERARFVLEDFTADAADPHRYDLVLNSSRLSVQDCAAAIIGTLHRLEARRVSG